uniref:Protein RFT1 homolog n=1 Tax=Entomoneis paludosa TaxID=265537 RepID=A0A7S2YLK1_9STRA
MGGIFKPLFIFCPKAAGAGQHRRAGEYVQISIWMYLIASIPHIVLWWFMTRSVFGWFGFDEDVADAAESYVRIAMFAELINHISEALHTLFYVSGYVITSTVIQTIASILEVAAILGLVFFTIQD